ncbi:MAG: hypothetical protein FJ095_05795 [Deltaproteobacteria bacterium]|nr:hypothetical protein [Deltaproteobacteria bacterium]
MMTSTRLLGAVGATLALFWFGCSEAVPPASQGAFIAEFRQPDGGKCKVASHPIKVGSATVKDLFDLRTDSVDGTTVQCTVTEASGGYTVKGLIDDGDGNQIDFTIPSISANASKAAPVKGNVGVRSPKTGDTYRSPGNDCSFWLERDNGAKGQVGSGILWVSFECPKIVNLGEASECNIDGTTFSSVIAMQNCDQ